MMPSNQRQRKKTERPDIIFVDHRPSENLTKRTLLYVHIGQRCLVAFLREKGFRSEILFNLDASIPTEKVLFDRFPAEIARKKPALLGFSPYCSLDDGGPHDIYKIEKIVKSAEDRGAHPRIVLGSNWASFNHKELMRDFPWIDFIVRGEGEQPLAELIEAIKHKRRPAGIAGLTWRQNGEIQVNPPRPNIRDLNELPVPALDHLELAKRNRIPITCVPISSSRGCHGRCSFCGIHRFYNLFPHENECWRPRSPINVADEMEAIYRRFKCDNFHFVDDNFMGPGEDGRDRARQIALEIISRKMKIRFSIMCRSDDVDRITMQVLKRAGLSSIEIGVESGSEHGLRTYAKGITVGQNRQALITLNQLGIRVDPFMIFLNPYSTLPEIKENLRFYRFTRLLSNVTWEGLPFFENFLDVRDGVQIMARVKKDGLLFGDYIKGYHYRFKHTQINDLKLIRDYLAYVFHAINSRIEKEGDAQEALALTRKRDELSNRFALRTFEKAVGLLARRDRTGMRLFLKKLRAKLQEQLAELGLTSQQK